MIFHYVLKTYVQVIMLITLLYNLEIIWKTSKTLRDTTLRMLQNDFKKFTLCSIQENAPAGIYLLKVNRSTRTRCETCSKLTIKTPERRHVNFEHMSHLVLVFLLGTLNM